VNALVQTVDAVAIEKSDRCCGEAGTFAISRPDVATQVRFRKEAEVRSGADRLRAATGSQGAAAPFTGEVKILTSCPSCLQGLKRYNDDADIDADYIVVEMARRILGELWLPQYVARANDGGIERVLV
jgi:Fe-S oxidoreductase